MDRRYLIASLFFIVAAVVAVVLVYPKYQVMSSSARIADEKQKEFDSQIALVQDISRLKSQYNEAKEEFGRVGVLIPAHSEGSAANLFVELEGLASRNGILLETISFGQSKTLGKEKEKRHFTINAKLSLKGDYRSLKNFVRAIETSEHLMDVVLISVSAVQEEKKEGKSEGGAAPEQPLSLKVDIDAYYQ
ncbi:type 4a pilus biogenesis protein PilO [Candidatus Azambacteria bacterium]|nr:type 4a pilus biogenesis protein PilO [Candidatus Azambacteria bacterium]